MKSLCLRNIDRKYQIKIGFLIVLDKTGRFLVDKEKCNVFIINDAYRIHQELRIESDSYIIPAFFRRKIFHHRSHIGRDPDIHVVVRDIQDDRSVISVFNQKIRPFKTPVKTLFIYGKFCTGISVEHIVNMEILSFDQSGINACTVKFKQNMVF